MTPYLLRTATSAADLCERLGYMRRRSDRSLLAPQPNQQGAHVAAGIAERAADGPELPPSLDPSPEPADEQVRLAQLTANAIAFPFAVRKAG